MTQLILDPIPYNDEESGFWYNINYNYVQENSPLFANAGADVMSGGGRGGVGNAWYFPGTGFYPSGLNFIYYVFPQSNTTWFVGGRYFLPDYPVFGPSVLDQYILSFVDSSQVQVSIVIGSDGKIRVCRGFETVLQTSAYVVPIGEWFHVEVYCVVDLVDGIIEVRVNESEKISYRGNTSENGMSRANLVSFNSCVIGQKLMDVNIRNGDDDETWWGDVSLLVLRPNDDSSVQFVGSDGDQIANYAIVQNMPFIEDEYVHTTQNAAIDLYEFPDLQDLEILGIADVFLPKTDECVAAAYPLVKAGGVLYQYNNIRIITQSDEYRLYLITQLQYSPNTGQRWGLSEFNQANFGQKSVLGASISGFVFVDELGNGTYENPPDEPAENAILALYLDGGDLVFNPATDTLVGTTRTLRSGLYGFTGLTPGSVYWVYLPPNPGYDPAGDNPIGPFTATTECLPVPDFPVFPA